MGNFIYCLVGGPRGPPLRPGMRPGFPGMRPGFGGGFPPMQGMRPPFNGEHPGGFPPPQMHGGPAPVQQPENQAEKLKKVFIL